MEFSFNGRTVRAFEGDTVACALARAGVHTLSRSMKFHRPRGMYCGAGRCISCVMRVDGVPGVRTCTLRVASGMIVESEGGFPSAGLDFLSVLDLIFRKELDYRSRFIRPRALTPLYQGVVRRLAAHSSLPSEGRAYPPLRRTECRVLVIGQGVSGSVASSRLAAADVSDVMAIDAGRGAGQRQPSFAFGCYEGGEVGVQVGEAVHVIKADHILIATGRFERGLPIVNGDLPGVILPSALTRFAAAGVSPGNRAVIVGTNERRASVVSQLESLEVEIAAEVEDPSLVTRIVGRRRVAGVELADRGRVRCDAVILMGPLEPAVELAQQAGCALVPRDGALSVKVDDSGRTTARGVFACGGVTGLRDPSERRASAERAAEAMIAQLGAD